MHACRVGGVLFKILSFDKPSACLRKNLINISSLASFQIHSQIQFVKVKKASTQLKRSGYY